MGINSVCVFCGSSPGKGNYWVNEAKELGSLLAKENRQIIYGGASIGVMGALADSAMKEGGKVLGVIPKSILEKEVANSGITKLHVVEDMHQRKNLMYSMSEAFVALPGGLGTLDEFFEILTWAQLGYHKKPIFLLNSNGFFDFLIKHLESALKEEFITQEHFEMVRVVKNSTVLISELNRVE